MEIYKFEPKLLDLPIGRFEECGAVGNGVSCSNVNRTNGGRFDYNGDDESRGNPRFNTVR